MSSIRTRLGAHPQTKHLIVYVLAGHGFNVSGKHIMLLNEYSKRTGFYKLWGIEAEIRDIARNYPNSFQVALFAGSREVLTSKHGGGFKSKQDALDGKQVAHKHK